MLANNTTQLGEAASIYSNDIEAISRGAWRYDRTRSRWQQFDYGAQRFADSAFAARHSNTRRRTMRALRNWKRGPQDCAPTSMALSVKSPVCNRRWHRCSHY